MLIVDPEPNSRTLVGEAIVRLDDVPLDYRVDEAGHAQEASDLRQRGWAPVLVVLMNPRPDPSLSYEYRDVNRATNGPLRLDRPFACSSGGKPQSKRLIERTSRGRRLSADRIEQPTIVILHGSTRVEARFRVSRSAAWVSGRSRWPALTASTQNSAQNQDAIARQRHHRRSVPHRLQPSAVGQSTLSPR